MSLKYPDETVCVALEKDNMLFAVGSQSHISFYDARCGKAVGFITSSDPGAGESHCVIPENIHTSTPPTKGIFILIPLTLKEFKFILYFSSKSWLLRLTSPYKEFPKTFCGVSIDTCTFWRADPLVRL